MQILMSVPLTMEGVNTTVLIPLVASTAGVGQAMSWVGMDWTALVSVHYFGKFSTWMTYLGCYTLFISKVFCSFRPVVVLLSGPWQRLRAVVKSLHAYKEMYSFSCWSLAAMLSVLLCGDEILNFTVAPDVVIIIFPTINIFITDNEVNQLMFCL